jgi:hypothetical protein
VEEALERGDALRVECNAPMVPGAFPIPPKPQPEPVPGQPSCRVVGPIKRQCIPSPVTGQPIEVGLVRILFIVPVTVIIINETVGVELCRFTVPVRFSDDVVLCLPKPLNETNVLCRIIDIECNATGLIFDGEVEIEVNICKEVQVEAEVKLEVLAKFCQPRGPFEIPPQQFSCPPRVDFPPQCDFFPIPNCDCQGSVHATNPGVTVQLDPTVTAVGTVCINSDICPNCNPSASSLRLEFKDTTPPNNSFVFNATEINAPTCIGTPPTTLIVTGRGTRNDGEILNFSLTLNAAGTYSIVLTNLAGVQVFSSGTLAAPVIVRDCQRLPYPI